jgi:phosphopantetheinyl transferase
MSSACAVALADRREMPPRVWASFLSVRESLEASTYRYPARRARTIASRVLAKYLAVHPHAGEFYRVGARDIEPASRSEWGDVELLSGTAKARSRATLFRAGRPCPDVWISSSHCGPLTASCMSRGYRIGVDLERIESRRREFHERAFSADERTWVARMLDRGSASADAAFTLLWSVKEAYLKASGCCEISVWAFPLWTVWLDDAVEGALRPDRREGFVTVSGGIRRNGFSQSFSVGGMRVGDMVLATVRYRETNKLAARSGSEVNDE